MAESHGWNLDGVEIRELTPPEDVSRSRRTEHDVSSRQRVELASTTKPILDGCRTAEADARRLRLALGAAPPRGHRAALPPADSCAEAVLRDPRLHGRAARRHDGDRPRPADAEHRARRRAARAAATPSTARSVAGCGRQVPWRAVSRRIPRLRDLNREGSRSSRGWSPPSTARSRRARSCASEIRRARHAARRRHRGRARARSSSAPPEPASRHWPRSSRPPPRLAASTRRSSSSTRAPKRC